MAINSSRVSEASFSYTRFRVRPEHGTQPNDLMDPAYWAHVCDKFRPTDILEVIPESGEWFAELMVVDVTKISARVRPLRLVQLIEQEDAVPAETPAAASEPFFVKWMGGAKWCVMRRTDNGILFRDLTTKDAAEAKLAEIRTPAQKAA